MNPGDSIVFDKVILLRSGDGVRVGTPHVEGARIEGEVIGDAKGPKLVVFKYRRRKDSRVKSGHRQKYTRVRVKKIEA
jgi:large subunit ribosomal protein L21